MSNFKPLNGRILIKADDAERTTESGIIIPDTVDVEKPLTGTIVTATQGVANPSIVFAPGDRVVFSRYGYDEVEIDKVKHYVVAESNIMGIFN